MFWILKRFRNKTATIILILIATISYLWKKSVGSLFGVFVVSLVCYFSSPVIFGIQPYSVSELVVWFSGLDSIYKTSIATSMITILGFLIAFHSANATWKKQIQNQLRLNAATDLQNVYNEVNDALINITIYADAILDTVKASKNNLMSEEAKFKVKYNFKKLEEFINEREKVQQATYLAMKVLRKYAHVLSSVFDTRIQVQNINNQLTNLNPVLYPSLPYVNLDDPNYVGNFVSQVNVDEWQRLKEQCIIIMNYINITSAKVNGYLILLVADFNIHTLIDLFRQRKILVDIVDVLSDKELTSQLNGNKKDNNHKI